MKNLITAIAILVGFASYSQNGLDFDGGDVVQTTYSGISGSSARTIEAWIKTTANCDPNNGGTQKIITDWGSFSTGARFTFCVLWANAIRVEVGGNGLSGTIAVNDGMWHHVAVVYDPTSGTPAQLFVDGVLDAAGSITVPVNSGSAVNLRIGQRIDNINGFDGQIDEVRVWNTAKTLVELTANMNNELCSSAPDLMAYYRLNEGTAAGTNTGLTTASDDSGNGNNGTLSGFGLNGATSNWVTGATLTGGMSSSTSTLTECGSYTWPLNSTTYTTSGFYSVVLPGANSTMCDSTVNLDLTIGTSNDLTTNVSECDSYTWSVNGMTYNQSTTVTETLVNGQGCSYLHTLNLNLGTSFDTTYQVDACGEFTWPVDGNTYTISGTYSSVMNLPNDCDSIAYLNLTLIPLVSPTIQSNADGSLTTSTSGIIQWLDCDNNYATIPGANSSTFIPTANGSYAVTSQDVSFCYDTSACMIVDYIGINENQFDLFKLSPNPTNGNVNIDLVSFQEEVTVEVYSVEGQLVQKHTAFGVENLLINLEGTPGMYIMKISTITGISSSYRIIKN